MTKTLRSVFSWHTSYRILPFRSALHNRSAPQPVVRGTSQLPETFYRMKIGQFSRELWPFFWLDVTFQELFKEISVARLINVRFSIRNHRWKAQNLLYQFQLSDLDLHSRRAPVNGRIRYIEYASLDIWIIHEFWCLSFYGAHFHTFTLPVYFSRVDKLYKPKS